MENSGSNFKLNIEPNVVFGDFKIRFVNEIKYLKDISKL